MDWECRHGLGTPEAESEMEVSMQVFLGGVLRSTPVEWRGGKLGGERGDPRTGPMTAQLTRWI